MKMSEENVKILRNTFRIPDSDMLTIWSMPGWLGCPLANPEHRATNCSLGFDHSGVPDELQPWMRGVERWTEIMKICKRCQGIPKPSDGEKEQLDGIRKSLFKRRSS